MNSWWLDLAACADDEDDRHLTVEERAQRDDVWNQALDDRAHGE